MLSFIQIIVLMSIIYYLIIIIVLERSHHVSRGDVKDTKALKHVYLLIGMLVYLIPHVISLAMNKYIYPNPDTYVIISSIKGKYPWSQAPVDPYYRPFPIYLMYTQFVHIVSGLDYHDSLVLVHLFSIIGILVGILLIVKLIFGEGFIANRWFLLFYPLVPASSIYLYGYTEIMIPQVFGVYVLVLMIYSFLNVLYRHGRVNRIIFILTSVVSLVHFGVAPVFVLLSTLYVVLILLRGVIKGQFVEIRLRYKRLIQVLLVLIFTVFLLHAYYVFIVFNPVNLNQYFRYYIQILYNLFFEPSRSIRSIIEPINYNIMRPYYYINALGPAIFLALTLVGIHMIIRRKIRPPPIVISSLIVGLVFIALGFGRLFVTLNIPSASIARYTNIYGLLLLSVFNSYVLVKIFNNGNILRNILIITLLLGFLGALLDPFVFQPRISVAESNYLRAASMIVVKSNIENIYFSTRTVRYYYGPPLFLWSSSSGHNISLLIFPHNCKVYDRILSGVTVAFTYCNNEIVVQRLGP